MRPCTKCGESDPAKFFHRKVASGELLPRSICKACHVAQVEARRKATGYHKTWYRKNKESHRRKVGKYYSKNKERVRKINAKWRSENINRVRSMEATRVRMLRQNDPIFRLISNTRRRLTGALSKFKQGKPARTEDVVGCDYAHLKDHLESKFRDGMSWDNYGKFWHVDHIRPVSSFDLTIEDQIFTCFHWSNLQPLLAKENLTKSNKYECNI